MKKYMVSLMWFFVGIVFIIVGYIQKQSIYYILGIVDIFFGIRTLRSVLWSINYELEVVFQHKSYDYNYFYTFCKINYYIF